MILLLFYFIFQTTSLVLTLTAKAFMCGCFTLMVFNFSVFMYVNGCINSIVFVCVRVLVYVCLFVCVCVGAHTRFMSAPLKNVQSSCV